MVCLESFRSNGSSFLDELEIQANVQEALHSLQAAWRELDMPLPPVLRPALKDRPQTVELLVSA